jgi:hypothetical protein
LNTGCPENNSFIITKNDKFAFSYHDQGKWYANMDGKVFGPYQDGRDVTIADNGKFSFNYKENDAWYVNMDGKALSTYRSTSRASNDYYYDRYQRYPFEQSDYYDRGYYPGSYGSYDDYYHDAPLDFFSLQKTYEPQPKKFNYSITIEANSPDKQHTFYSDMKYEYVVIDGKIVGKSPAVQAWYNEENNSFAWNSVEGKELVMYEYKLK